MCSSDLSGKLFVLEVNAQCGLSEDENYTSIGAILNFNEQRFSTAIFQIMNDAWLRSGVNKKDDAIQTCTFTKDGGKTWSKTGNTNGYRSCVEYLKKNKWIACGLNGVDLTDNNGVDFRKISDVGFHVCRKAKNGNAVFLAGGSGRIGKLINK